VEVMIFCKLGESTSRRIHHTTPPLHREFLLHNVREELLHEAPAHELGKFQRNTLNFTTLSACDAEEGENLGRRRRSIMQSSARTWSSIRYIGLVFTPHRAARAPFHRY
jgi:hypothetical protein